MAAPPHIAKFKIYATFGVALGIHVTLVSSIQIRTELSNLSISSVALTSAKRRLIVCSSASCVWRETSATPSLTTIMR